MVNARKPGAHGQKLWKQQLKCFTTRFRLKEPWDHVAAAVTIALVIFFVSATVPGAATSMAGKMTNLTEGAIKINRMASMADKLGRSAKIATRIATIGSPIMALGSGTTGLIGGLYQVRIPQQPGRR